MIDRYSSITLDRPCAIADKYILIGFPADANDEDIQAADVSGSFPNLDSFCAAISLNSPSGPTNTEMSVFFACLRLRQITSTPHLPTKRLLQVCEMTLQPGGLFMLRWMSF
jgi:hypothetical protein